MGDVEAALAFVARRCGRRAMPPASWVHELSLGLGWMPPGQARDFVQRAQDAGLLVAAGTELDLRGPLDVAIPIGFRPGPDAVPEGASQAVATGGGPETPRSDPFLEWADRVAAHGKVARAHALAQVAARQERMGGMLSAWAALLWLAADEGLDVRMAAAGPKP